MLVINSDNNSIYPKYASGMQGFARKIKALNHSDVFFKAEQKKETPKDKNYENPINSGLEYLDAAKLTAAAGVGVAIRIGAEFIDSAEFTKKGLKTFALACLGIGAVYALLTLPKNLYNRKVETFQKKKEMDVYVRSNSAEQKLYERVNEEAKEADEDKKQELIKDLTVLKTGKNQVPDFIKQY